MRMLRAVLGTYGSGSWRRIGYLLLGLPVGVAALALVVVGRAGTAARCHHWLAVRVGRAPEGAPPTAGRVAAGSLGAAVVSLAGWVLAQWIAFIVLINVAFPWRDYLIPVHHAENVGLLPWSNFAPHALAHPENIWASTYHGSWGGPTLAGAWAVHAGLVVLVLLPVVIWLLRGLARLQLRLAGSGRRPDGVRVGEVGVA
jgi:hypothetical protein